MNTYFKNLSDADEESIVEIIESAISLLDDVQFQRISLYYFLGKIDDWPASVPVLADSSNSDVEIRNNIAYLQKIDLGSYVAK